MQPDAEETRYSKNAVRPASIPHSQRHCCLKNGKPPCAAKLLAALNTHGSEIAGRNSPEVRKRTKGVCFDLDQRTLVDPSQLVAPSESGNKPMPWPIVAIWLISLAVGVVSLLSMAGLLPR